MEFDYRSTKLSFKATIDFYTDSGFHTHRAHKEFSELEKAKKWVTRKLDPDLNIQWCICDGVGIELEGN